MLLLLLVLVSLVKVDVRRLRRSSLTPFLGAILQSSMQKQKTPAGLERLLILFRPIVTRYLLVLVLKIVMYLKCLLEC